MNVYDTEYVHLSFSNAVTRPGYCRVSALCTENGIEDTAVETRCLNPSDIPKGPYIIQSHYRIHCLCGESVATV